MSHADFRVFFAAVHPRTLKPNIERQTFQVLSSLLENCSFNFLNNGNF